MIRVVVVEDDTDLCEETVYNLSQEGADAVGMHDGPSLYRYLMKFKVDIVVLDIGLPGENGFTIARHLRESPGTRSIGIIMLTALGESENRVEGMDSGADIYLVKPTPIRELHAAIKSLARRLQLSSRPADPLVWRYSHSTRTLTAPSGADTHLSSAEKALIEFFLHNPGSVAKRRDIVNKGLGEDFLTYDQRRLEAIVSRLRRKLAQISPLTQPLRAVHGVGYEFTAFLEPKD
jgi:DNA-binding response OmpR family regulator